MSVAQTKSKAARAEPSRSLKAQLEASIAEPYQTAAEHELGDRVIGALEPISEDFIAELRAVGTALFHLIPAIEDEDGNMIAWCSRWIGAKADVLEEAVESVRDAARTSWNEMHPKGGEA
jgi:hypothetical protein